MVLAGACADADAKNGGAREAACRWCSGEVHCACRRARADTGQQRALGRKTSTRQSIRMRAQASGRGHEAKGSRQTVDAARALCWCRGRGEDWAGTGRMAGLRQLETLDWPGCQSRQFVNSGVEVARATRPNRTKVPVRDAVKPSHWEPTTGSPPLACLRSRDAPAKAPKVAAHVRKVHDIVDVHGDLQTHPSDANRAIPPVALPESLP